MHWMCDFPLAVPEDGKDFAGLLANVPSLSRCQSSDCLEPLIIKGYK